MALEHEGQACALLGQGLARGWTLGRALRLAAAGCTDTRLRAALSKAAALAEEGKSLDEVLSDAGLPPAMREAAAACTTDRDAGDLLDVLASASIGVRRMKRRLAAAVAYPLLLVGATVGAGIYVVHWVLPLVQHWHLETSGNASLVKTFGLEALLGLPGALLLFALTTAAILAWTRGGIAWRTRLLAPLVAVTRAGAIQALATLLRSGRPLPDSLSRVARACGDNVARRALLRARARVEQGDGAAEALVATGLVPLAWAGPLRSAEGDGDRLTGAIDGVGKALALEAELGAETLPAVVLPLATILAGALVAWIGLVLFGGLQWYS